MIWLILVLIYLISFAIHILLIYFECKRYIYKVRDLIEGDLVGDDIGRWCVNVKEVLQ